MFDHLLYYRGTSKTNLINRLETRDGMSYDTAQNLDVDYAQDVIVRSKYFSGMIYSDVNREDYERYYEKWL